MINIEPFSKTRSRSPSPSPEPTAATNTTTATPTEQTTSASTSSSLTPQPTKTTPTTSSPDDITSVADSLSTLTVTSRTSTANTIISTTTAATTIVANDEPKEELSPEEAKLRAQGLKSTHRPGFYIHINSPKRLRIQTSSKTFDLDRYCPHANADMLKWRCLCIDMGLTCDAIGDGSLTTRHDLYLDPGQGPGSVSDSPRFLCADPFHNYLDPHGCLSLCFYDAGLGLYDSFWVDSPRGY
ncbi:hypothetical protein BG015_005594 [Linnemannia schmuckeri]|uniref:Uncharacterized protein n=1 Tax=Linnemannia schmuckeri TaxID=64567 RepID=A0A9P5S6K4_9FUNG|nr:hypothetical protein BG015_005594 [Linnemannia schmuckeri]